MYHDCINILNSTSNFEKGYALIKEKYDDFKYEYYKNKEVAIETINKRMEYVNHSKEHISKNLSKYFTVREDDWSWLSGKKKETRGP